MRTIGSYEDGRSLIIEACSRVPTHKTCCLFCKTRKFGTKKIRFRDYPVQENPVWIEVRRQRFQCVKCGAILYEDLPDLDDDRRVTLRFRWRLEQHAVDHTFSDAARINGVHETLVRRVFTEYARYKLEHYMVSLPRVLGMDEKHILGRARFVIGDVENRRMLDLQESRNTKDLVNYFEAMLGREKVEVVTQDMWTGYLTVTKKVFPRAVTVIDKYHVVRMGNFGVEFVRKALYLGLTKRDRISLKRKNKLFLVRWNRASPETQGRLNKLFAAYPALNAAYTAKERFYDIYESPNRGVAEAALTAWQNTLPEDMHRPFKEALTAIGNWRPYILRYFEHPYTNAYVERLNGLVTTLNRNAAGLTYDVLRAKALLKFGTLRDVHFKGPPGSEDAVGYGVFQTTTSSGVDISTLDEAIRDSAF